MFLTRFIKIYSEKLSAIFVYNSAKSNKFNDSK